MQEENDSNGQLALLGCLTLVALFAVALVLTVAGSIVYNATDLANRQVLANNTATAAAVESAARATVEAALAAATTDEAAASDASRAEAFVLPPATRTAAPAATAGLQVNRLVVVDAAGQILTVNPDGTDEHRLTQREDAIRYIFPAWSPDGQFIAAVGADTRGPDSGIYVLTDAGNAAPQRIAGQPNSVPIYLFWAPDSNAISYIQGRPGTSLLDLQIVPRDASETSRVLATGQPLYWDWAADGSALLINTGRSEHAGFAYVPPLAGQVGEAIAEVGRFQSPDISADDRFIAYVEDSSEGDAVVIADRFADNSISVPHSGFASLGWSPNDNLLAYLGPTPVDVLPFSGALTLLDTEGNARLLANDSVLAFFWSPDGRYITYISIASFRRPAPEAGLTPRGVRFASARPQPVQLHSILTFELWAHDLVEGGNRLLATFTPTELFVQQFIPYFDQYARSHSLWAPDSSALVLPVFADGESIIYRFPLNGDRPMPVVSGDIAFWSRQ